jgi:two-component system NtrC family response regulator
VSYQLASREVRADFAPSGKHATDIGFQAIVGRSPALLKAIQFSMRVATRRGTAVLIVGDTGTGKGLFALGIHYASPEAQEPFVTVNCAAIPANLLESELFGHERGAFTDARARKLGLLELAGAGTLFLDEISELPPNLQPKLLRALEERRFRRVGGTAEIEVRCRLIASSNASFEDALSEGRFREDLFYRLNVLRINIPPLKERGDDRVILARYFMEQISHEMGVAPKTFSADALDILKLHSWPGNVRELKNVIQRALTLSDGPEIDASHLSIFERHGNGEGRDGDPAQAIHIPDTGMTLAEIEAEALRITLRLTGGNRSAAARILAISRPTIHRKIRNYGLEEGV